jgi:hypothetical protein
MPRFANLVDRSGAQLAELVALAAVLFLGAAAGMAWIAGFDGIRKALERPGWPWLGASLALVALSFVGYYLGYRGVTEVEDGPTMPSTGSRLAVVVAGFGGFLVRGGSALDDFALRSAGASEREAKVRVTMLAGLEHGTLGIPCSVAAIVLLATGVGKPPLDFTIPWAVIPAVGFAVAFWLAERHRDSLRWRTGWHGKLGVFLDAVHLIRVMFCRGRHLPAVAGMVLFWVSDMLALWAAIAAFGFRMNVASTAVAFGTAMIVTRRTGPLGGAGILMAAVPPTLWVSGAPWVPAVLGTLAYRVFTLWLPMPLAFAALPRLRELGHETEQPAEAPEPVEEKEPALRT